MVEDTDGGSGGVEPGRQQLASGQTSQPAASNTAQSTASGGKDEEPLRSAAVDMHQFIGRQLRAVFDDVAKQPIPDRFLELMKQLDGK